jgi:MerR family transcriptional regulator, light-induced transcriptional regulator
MSKYSIKDLEQLSGIKAHTLRIWEQRFNFISPQRTDSNIRFYNDRDLKLVLNISLLKDHGYKISEIAQMNFDQIATEVLTISEKQLNYPDQIQALTLAMIEFDEDAFENIMVENIKQFGFENTMIKIIYPFLAKIGVLWQTGSIGPSQEHFITQLIRQKLMVAIDSIPVALKPGYKKFIVYTPEGEYHDIGVIFGYFILKSRNHKVYYLGQSLPFADLEFVVNKHNPDAIFTAITSFSNHQDVQFYINKVSKYFPKIDFMVTGSQIIGQGLDLPENTTIINKVQDLMEIANS